VRSCAIVGSVASFILLGGCGWLYKSGSPVNTAVQVVVVAFAWRVASDCLQKHIAAILG